MNRRNDEPVRLKIGIDHGELGRLLDAEEILFRRLHALSLEQGRLVQEEQTDELLHVLGNRQKIVDELQQVSGKLEPFRDQWEQVLATARTEQREKYTMQVQVLGELAANIAARDDEDRKLLAKRRDGLAEDLSGVGRVQGAVAAYGPSSSRPAARFQDTEG